jgi:hypothetical protein
MERRKKSCKSGVRCNGQGEANVALGGCMVTDTGTVGLDFQSRVTDLVKMDIAYKFALQRRGLDHVDIGFDSSCAYFRQLYEQNILRNEPIRATTNQLVII